MAIFRFFAILGITIFTISWAILGLGYSIASTGETVFRNISIVANILGQLLPYSFGLAVFGTGCVGFSIIYVVKCYKFNKLHDEIIRNKIVGKNEKEKCDEIYKGYLTIVRRKNMGDLARMSNSKLYTGVIGLILIVIFGGLYYYTQNLQLVFSGLVALATLVYSYLTFQLVKLNKDMRDIQKKQMEPNINIDFQHEENSMNMVHLVIENIGRNIARNVKINIEPDMEFIKGRKLSDLHIIKNKHDIPANKRIKFFLTNMLQDAEEKTKEPYKINVDYENESGDKFHREFEIDLKMLTGTLYTAYTPMIDIRNFLDKISSNIDALINGRRKITVINYSKEEVREEREENLKWSKQLIEKKKQEKQEKEKNK